MKNKKIFKERIKLLDGKQCVEIGTSVGSTLLLSFGNLIYDDKDSSQINKIIPEYHFLVICSWRLEQRKKTLCTSGDYMLSNRKMDLSIEILMSKRLLKTKVIDEFYDIVFYFEDNLILRFFCDIYSEKDDKGDVMECYDFFTPGLGFSIYSNNLIEVFESNNYPKIINADNSMNKEYFDNLKNSSE
ncbi:MAG: hypothetical protein ACK5C0_04455 [Candidatus Kapaibacterium sp.]|jgi:hypothetical protein